MKGIATSKWHREVKRAVRRMHEARACAELRQALNQTIRRMGLLPCETDYLQPRR